MFPIYGMSTFTQIYGIIHLTYSSIVYNFSRFTTGNLASVLENHGKRYRMPMESTCPAWAQARQTVKPTQFPLFFPGPLAFDRESLLEHAWTIRINKVLFQKIWFCPLPHPVDSIEGPLLAVFPQKKHGYTNKPGTFAWQFHFHDQRTLLLLSGELEGHCVQVVNSTQR